MSLFGVPILRQTKHTVVYKEMIKRNHDKPAKIEIEKIEGLEHELNNARTAIRTAQLSIGKLNYYNGESIARHPSLIPERREKVKPYDKALQGSIKRVNELNSRIHYLEKRKQIKQFISIAKKDAARMQADEDSINYIFNKLCVTPLT